MVKAAVTIGMAVAAVAVVAVAVPARVRLAVVETMGVMGAVQGHLLVATMSQVQVAVALVAVAALAAVHS